MAAPAKVDRSTILFVVIIFVSGLFLFELFKKQVLQHSQYAAAAEEQSTAVVSQPAQRGQILAQDRDGKLFTLAVSDWRYQLLISPRQVKNKEKLVDELKTYIPTLDRADTLSKITNDKVYVPPIIKDLDVATAQKIADKDYAGVFMLPVLLRVYPDGDGIAPQILGFVGADSEGKYGVEASQDKVLRGTSGDEKAKRDSLGRLIDVLGGKEPESGQDVVLTIDYNLQYTVETKLKQAIETYQADGGSIVVMNPKTGGVLAIAGSPKYDPNAYSSLPAADQFKFLSPAVSNIYEPGSVMKPVTMAMALDMGAVTPETTHDAGGSVTVSGYEIRNAEDKVYGNETMSQILENSDNVQMVWISSLIGPEKEREYFDKFGFGQKTGINLVGEQAGDLRDKKEWRDLLRSTAAFGQGVSVTTLQMAAAYSVLANGGYKVTPHLAQKYLNDGQEEVIEQAKGAQVISPETSNKIREMLVNVVVHGHGKRAKVDGIRVGGKTGTAQVPDPSGGYYEDRHIGTFAGLFPADDPKFVMVVRLDNPKTVKFAESSAAPTFGEIANWITNYYQLR